MLARQQQSIAELATSVRDAAARVTIGHGRKTTELYAVLADSLEICERCQRDSEELKRLEEMFAAQPKGDQNRRYVERGSDIYIQVCRFVFAHTNLAAASRYAVALREAAKRQVRSSELSVWLPKNGGVNALYYQRQKLRGGSMTTKTIRLDTSVQFPRTGTTTLVLRWSDNNTFQVVSASTDRSTGD